MYAALARCPLFRGLEEDKIKEIIDGRGDYTLNDYRDGEYIARRDTTYSGLMIILEGKVHGEMTLSSGKPVMIEPIEAPRLIAPAFLFGGYNKLPVDVVADGPVRIMTLHRGYVFELMQSHVVIMSNFIDIVSDRANVWSKKIYYLSFRSLKEKVATYLLDHTSDGNPQLPMPDIREIAEYLDATRSAVLTVLAEMEKKRLLENLPDAVRVLNRKGLEDILK